MRALRLRVRPCCLVEAAPWRHRDPNHVLPVQQGSCHFCLTLSQRLAQFFACLRQLLHFSSPKSYVLLNAADMIELTCPILDTLGIDICHIMRALTGVSWFTAGKERALVSNIHTQLSYVLLLYVHVSFVLSSPTMWLSQWTSLRALKENTE